MTAGATGRLLAGSCGVAEVRFEGDELVFTLRRRTDEVPAQPTAPRAEGTR
jgi:hypothetical protein